MQNLFKDENSSSSTSETKIKLDESTIVDLLVNITSIAKKSHGMVGLALSGQVFGLQSTYGCQRSRQQ